jgi:mono/diheme cytochrome c family protein
MGGMGAHHARGGADQTVTGQFILRGLAVLVVGGALAGCGSSSRPKTGAALFSEECSACHSLVGRQSPRLQGGDLLGYRFSREAMLEFAREMPVRRALDAAELRAVVNYVIDAERRG